MIFSNTTGQIISDVVYFNRKQKKEKGASNPGRLNTPLSQLILAYQFELISYKNYISFFIKNQV